jgi:hypothetical protein
LFAGLDGVPNFLQRAAVLKGMTDIFLDLTVSVEQRRIRPGGD